MLRDNIIRWKKKSIVVSRNQLTGYGELTVPIPGNLCVFKSKKQLVSRNNNRKFMMFY